MKQLYIRLETLAPLSLHANHASAGVDATDYIAGNTLIGSLAAAHRLCYPTKKEEFEQFFLQERILYPHLFPAVLDDENLSWQDMHVPVYPVPGTAQSCKRCAGFLYPKAETNDGHGVRDTLIDWAVFKLGMQAGVEGTGFDPLSALRKNKMCALCGEPMDHFDGYYRRNELSRAMMAARKQTVRLQTRIGIDREAGIARNGVFYHQQAFGEGTLFWGEIRLLDEHLFDSFKNFIQAVGTAGLIRMGSGRTRGMGKVKIEAVESGIGEQERSARSVARLQSFNALLVKNLHHRVLERFQQLSFFTITLHAPLILCDDFLRYRSTIDASVLQELLGMPVHGLKRVYQHATTRHIMGWQELWGTPRASEYAIDTGSVFLFCCTILKERLLDALFNLEEQGIGRRRAEGFGRICISDPFHREVAPK